MRKYSNNIFPRDLWIARSLREAEEDFTSPDGEFETIEHTNAIASVYPVNLIKEDKGGILLIVRKTADVRTIAHEALHITRLILEDLPCGLNDETEETWCYVIGWVADCIQDYLGQD